MSKNKRWIWLMLTAAAAVVLSTYLLSRSTVREDMFPCQVGVEKMQKAAKLELPPNANEEVIKSFLSKHQFTFSYDRFAHRYQAIIRNIDNPPGVDCAIVGYVYVNKEGKYIKSEFVASYTGM